MKITKPNPVIYYLYPIRMVNNYICAKYPHLGNNLVDNFCYAVYDHYFYGLDENQTWVNIYFWADPDITGETLSTLAEKILDRFPKMGPKPTVDNIKELIQIIVQEFHDPNRIVYLTW